MVEEEFIVKSNSLSERVDEAQTMSNQGEYSYDISQDVKDNEEYKRIKSEQKKDYENMTELELE